jgi:hypothetical protein
MVKIAGNGLYDDLGLLGAEALGRPRHGRVQSHREHGRGRNENTDHSASPDEASPCNPQKRARDQQGSCA